MKNRTNQSLLIATILVAFCAIIGFMWTAAPAVGSDGDTLVASGDVPHANPVFARRITGTWWLDVPDWTVPGSDAVILNIRADGTLTWNSTWQFGAGGGESFDSVVHGIWKQTGPHQITTHELGFIFNGDGLHWFTGRVTVVYDFSPDFQTFNGIFEEDAFWPDQNPVLEEPFFSWDGELGTGYRLNIVN